MDLYSSTSTSSTNITTNSNSSSTTNIGRYSAYINTSYLQVASTDSVCKEPKSFYEVLMQAE